MRIGSSFGHLLLAACWCLSALAETANPQPRFPISVQLDWKPTAQFAGLLVAQAKGYYRQEGLDVTLLPADDGMKTVELSTTHSNYVGVAEAEVLLADSARGYRMKAFATMLQATPFSLFTLKQSGLTTFKSLKGKRIGLYGDGQRAIGILLEYNGMARGDVTIADIPYTLDSLVSGKVDAMQGYVIDEGVRLEMEGHPVNVIPMSENGYRSYAEVLFGTDAFVHAHPRELAAFLRATRRGWDDAIAHPDETAALIVEKYEHATTVAEQRASLAKVIPLLDAETRAETRSATPDNSRFGMMLPVTWRQCAAAFNRYHPGARPVSADDLVDYSVLGTLYGPGSVVRPPDSLP